jgi:hypothetical protein
MGIVDIDRIPVPGGTHRPVPSEFATRRADSAERDSALLQGRVPDESSDISGRSSAPLLALFDEDPPRIPIPQKVSGWQGAATTRGNASAARERRRDASRGAARRPRSLSFASSMSIAGEALQTGACYCVPGDGWKRDPERNPLRPSDKLSVHEPSEDPRA